jgi:hypothetical protein
VTIEAAGRPVEMPLASRYANTPMRLAPSPYFPVSQKFKTLISLSAMETQPLETALVLAHQLADEISGDDEQQDSVDST